MKRTDAFGAKADLFGPGKSGFTDGSPGVEAPTVLESTIMNSLQEEIANAIESFGGVALNPAALNQLSTVLTNKYNALTAADGAVALAREHRNAIGALLQATSTVTPWHEASIAYVSEIITHGLTLACGTDYPYFAACSGGKIAGSFDGVSWTLGSAANSYTGDFAGATYAHGNILMFGASGEIQSVPVAGGSLTATRRKTGGAKVVAVQNNAANDAVLAVDSSGHVWTSTAGLTWSDLGALLSSPTDLTIGKTTADADCFAAVDGAAVKVSTDDGATWTSHTVSASATLARLSWCADLEQWFVVGKDSSNVGGIWSSADAVTWTRLYTGDAGVTVVAVTRVPGGIFAVANDGRVICWDGTTTRYTQTASGSAMVGQQPFKYTYCNDRNEAVIWAATQNGFSTDSYVYRSVSWSPVVP
jgi:hypothetical protein